ncbi:uncharacterized protein LOC128241434 [Mya arenaria]|uniref:uncharacterized protein LOC128241434 n=1 Tax=Mya arenaria TaxID=6604 RepID=UPI0022E49DEA|nr:uncharacterized protein LOC128241434 [Mya arenaria]
MLLSHEGLLHKGSEFCQAIKFVIKLQISTLLQQLAESGEESVVLTANVLEGTADRLGSLRGTGFLEDHEQLGNQFLSYCAETRRFSVDDEGDNLPARTTYNDSLLSPTIPKATSPYSRTDTVRARYERESSTSDSVFSPDRRKSSASSKSLDEDVAMLTSQDYSDTPRSLSDSSTTWPPDLVMEGVEKGERSAGSGSRYVSIVRSPTGRSGSSSLAESEKSKHISKSPLSESVEHIKQITLSSPSEFQYKRYHQHAGGFPGGSGSGTFDPQLLPPMFELVSPPKPQELTVPTASSEETDVSYNIKSNTPSSTGSGTLISSEVEMAEQTPMNLTGSEKNQSSELTPSPASTTGSESVFCQYPVYKVPYPAYPSGMVRPKTEETNSDLPYRLMLGASYEGQDAEAKYKTQMIQSESAGTKSHQGTEQYSSLTESREYQSELGEIYRLPKKMESKLYHQRNNNGGRKQSKTHVERRCSESMIQNYETSGLFTAFHKDKEILGTETVKLEHDVILQPDISKSFEEAVKIQQSLFQTSLGMFSPIQRQFLQPSRPFPQRERSQSLSEFHTLAQDIPHPSGRARFPSSSFAENLDSPLVIDDDSKPESESREGLDLSNKKRKMSADDIYPMSADDPQEGAGLNAAANQSEEQEFAGGAGVSRSPDDGGVGGTKKYGKGNFIKVATGYQCRICCRVIRHMNNTTAHMRIHANVKPYKCQVCNQQFKYEVDRRYHFSKNHVDLFSKMYFPDDKKSS